MATVLAYYPSDSPGYTHFIVLEPVDGVITAEVDGLEYGYDGPPDREGASTFRKGDPITSVSVGLSRAREFSLAGNIKSLTFPDGTTWTSAE